MEKYALVTEKISLFQALKTLKRKLSIMKLRDLKSNISDKFAS